MTIEDLEKGKFTLENWQVSVNTLIATWDPTDVPEWLTRQDLEEKKFTPWGKVRLVITTA